MSLREFASGTITLLACVTQSMLVCLDFRDLRRKFIKLRM